MGSKARVVVYASEDPADAVGRAFAAIDGLDRTLSDYNPNSEARRLTAMPAGVWRDASPALIDALEKSRAVWEASGGEFDVTIGAVSALWRGASAAGRRPTAEELGEARACVGMTLVEIDRERGRVRLARDGVIFDFGGIGKGIAADAAVASLRADGLACALVEIGGDLAAGEAPPGSVGWSVRVSDGGSEGAAVTVSNAGVATSGDAYRFTEIDGVRASHVIEPGTAQPTPEGGAVTVIAPAGWVADAVATVGKLRGEAAAREAGRWLGGVRVIDPARLGADTR
ncbi:MAG: FAD:protein FMN transferase [Phycisphaerales bacterium]